MASVRLPEALETRLSALAATTQRSKGFFLKEALEMYLDDMEDAHLALTRIASPIATFETSEELLAALNHDKTK